MKTFLFVGAMAVAVAGAAYYTTTRSQSQEATASPAGAALVAVTLPATLSPQAQTGKQAFDAVCAACHGVAAAGKDGFGPPLVHVIYEPNHHADIAFYRAAENGVRAHHWRFGDMPAQKGLTKGDLANIVTYVRELQRANGIE